MKLDKSGEKIAAYLFGVTFVIVILVIAIAFPSPKPFQVFVFRVVLALAAAGVAAMIPGFLSVDLGGLVRAGGAIAVFVVVFFLNPAELVSEPDPGPTPPGDARSTADAYLVVADGLDFERAWPLFSSTARSRYDKAQVSEAYANVRIPLGTVQNRSLEGVQSASAFPGWPAAHYRGFGYRTVFSDGRPRSEHVVVMSEDDTWRVAVHTIDPSPRSGS